MTEDEKFVRRWACGPDLERGTGPWRSRRKEIEAERKMMERHSLLIGEQDRLWDRRLLVVFVIFLVFALALILPGLFL